MIHRLIQITKKLSPNLKKIVGSIGWLMAERILSIIVSLVVTISVIRYLGPASFGKLSYAVSFAGLFMPIAKLGLDIIVVRNIVRDEKSTETILGTAFVLKFVASIITIILMGWAIWSFDSDSQLRWLTLIIAFGLFFDSFEVITFWFQSKVIAGAMVLIRSGQVMLSSIAKLLFIYFQLPLIAFVWLIFGESLVKAVGMIAVYKNYHQSIFRWKFEATNAVKMLKDSWPLIFSGVMITLYMKIDQVMLGNMSNTIEVGNYAAAVRFSELWYFIPMSICSSVFPAIIRARQRSQQEYYMRLQQLYDLMMWLALLIAIPLTFSSDFIINTLLGKEYPKAGEILALHIWAGPFVFLGVAREQWLMAENLTRFSLIATSLGAIINIVLNYYLIPDYGGLGAAIATVISYSISGYFTCFIYFSIWKTGWMLTKALLVPFRIHQNWIYFSYVKKIFT